MVHDGGGVVVRYVVVEVDARCVVSYLSQHRVVLLFIVKTDDADMIHLVNVVSSLIVGDITFDGVSMNNTLRLSTTSYVFGLYMRVTLASSLYPQSFPSQDLSSSFCVCCDAFERPGPDGLEVAVSPSPHRERCT